MSAPSEVTDDNTNEETAADTDEDETPPPPPCSSGFISSPKGITVELLGQDLWKKFYKLGTEMIITKAGR